jgi:hypothetical protein
MPLSVKLSPPKVLSSLTEITHFFIERAAFCLMLLARAARNARSIHTTCNEHLMHVRPTIVEAPPDNALNEGLWLPDQEPCLGMSPCFLPEKRQHTCDALFWVVCLLQCPTLGVLSSKKPKFRNALIDLKAPLPYQCQC